MIYGNMDKETGTSQATGFAKMKRSKISDFFSKTEQCCIEVAVSFELRTGSHSSHVGLGAVLSQDQDGQRKVITYGSGRLRLSEKNPRNCSSMKLELLTLKWVVTYLFGSKCEVFTDNNPLKSGRSYANAHGPVQDKTEESKEVELLPIESIVAMANPIPPHLSHAIVTTPILIEERRMAVHEPDPNLSTVNLSSDEDKMLLRDDTVIATTSFPTHTKEELISMQKADPTGQGIHEVFGERHETNPCIRTCLGHKRIQDEAEDSDDEVFL
ncbi:hypothetical protein AWC38_SpisGene14532 [Stylophora pistillata]|uniref:Reverse transcriptase RNase H-like domain-containing protein n=1 Tax=Stylophora pistillata TaxID=50429 RepID=A0A2B4RTP4_STYPI|nr:hypothetical protein AWC38_SpisGene14532 [Stylophora pistillata]